MRVFPFCCPQVEDDLTRLGAAGRLLEVRVDGLGRRKEGKRRRQRADGAGGSQQLSGRREGERVRRIRGRTFRDGEDGREEWEGRKETRQRRYVTKPDQRAESGWTSVG